MEQGDQATDGVEEAKGLACFLDQGRICSADCMAYLTTPPEGKHYIGEHWPRCHVLVNMDRGGRHLVVLAGDVNKLVGMKRGEQRQEKAPGVG